MSDSATGCDRVPNSTGILLIDDDPIFRLGLRTALEPFPDLQVVAEADTGAAALEILGHLPNENAVDLVVLELSSGRHANEELKASRLNVVRSNDRSSRLAASSAQAGHDPNLEDNLQPSTSWLSGVSLCQHLKAEYPNLLILLLTAQSQATELATAKDSGVDGYCCKGSTITEIVLAIRQLISGQSYWQRLPTQPSALASSVRPPSWHHKLRQSGLQQIEAALTQVTQNLKNPKSNVDWLFWSGRRRELLAARWIVNQLLPTDVIVVSQELEREQNAFPVPISTLQYRRLQTIGRQQQSLSQSSIPKSQIPLVSVSEPTAQLSSMPHQVSLFDVTLAKLQSGLINLTSVVLEIDILSDKKKQDLLAIILWKLEEFIDELRFSQVTLEQLPQKRSLILQDLWQASVTEFFGKYSTLPVGDQELEVVGVLLQYALIIQAEILDKIPLVIEFLAHQLFETPLIINNVSYPAQTPEAIERAEILLQNLIIQVANAVIQPLLNEFAEIEIVKQSFYNQRLISSREITQFRNNLSWKYRLLKLLKEPEAIFESRYNLFFLSDIGIKQISIYAPRSQELEQLQGIQLAVTLAYELRDAIAPRLRAVVTWVGRGIVYVLTQVIGKSIGLVVRGVIQGIGSSLQETRFGKSGERGK